MAIASPATDIDTLIPESTTRALDPTPQVESSLTSLATAIPGPSTQAGPDALTNLVASTSTTADQSHVTNHSNQIVTIEAHTDKAVANILPYLKSISTNNCWTDLIANWLLFEQENPPRTVRVFVIKCFGVNQLIASEFLQILVQMK